MPERENNITSDEAIRNKILDDHEAGWIMFWNAHEGFIHRLVGRFTLSPENREEVVQEISYALINQDYKVFRIWDPSLCSLRGFISIIVSRTVYNFFRSSFYTAGHIHNDPLDESNEVKFLEQFVDPHQTPREHLHQLVLAEYLDKMLDELVTKEKITDVDRNLILLRLRGYKFKEISKMLGITKSQATVRFVRIKPMLKKRLNEDGIIPGSL